VLIGLWPVHSFRQSSGWVLTRVTADDVSNEIAKVRADWAKALYSKQLDQIAMRYAPDAVFLTPTGDRITGRAAIRDLCKKAMATYTSDIKMRSAALGHSGNLAYDSGDYEETEAIIANGTSKNLKGTYLMVYRRQADGHWLILQQMWADGTPAHADPTPK
jgi:uncharacterized protein (TIGR02246 family)